MHHYLFRKRDKTIFLSQKMPTSTSLKSKLRVLEKHSSIIAPSYLEIQSIQKEKIIVYHFRRIEDNLFFRLDCDRGLVAMVLLPKG